MIRFGFLTHFRAVFAFGLGYAQLDWSARQLDEEAWQLGYDLAANRRAPPPP